MGRGLWRRIPPSRRESSGYRTNELNRYSQVAASVTNGLTHSPFAPDIRSTAGMNISRNWATYIRQLRKEQGNKKKKSHISRAEIKQRNSEFNVAELSTKDELGDCGNKRYLLVTSYIQIRGYLLSFARPIAAKNFRAAAFVPSYWVFHCCWLMKKARTCLRQKYHSDRFTFYASKEDYLLTCNAQSTKRE